MEVPLLEWPQYDPDQLDPLRRQLVTRLDAVAERLIARHIRGPFRRLGLRTARKFFRKGIADRIVQAMADDLRDRGLMR